MRSGEHLPKSGVNEFCPRQSEREQVDEFDASPLGHKSPVKVERITPASPSRDAVDEVRSGGRSHQNTWVPTDDKLGIHQDSSDRYNQYVVRGKRDMRFVLRNVDIL